MRKAQVDPVLISSAELSAPSLLWDFGKAHVNKCKSRVPEIHYSCRVKITLHWFLIKVHFITLAIVVIFYFVHRNTHSVHL